VSLYLGVLNDVRSNVSRVSFLQVAVSLYLDMLNDVRRNAAYHLALQQAVKPGDTVLDIG
jgi:hypothetical protein